VPNLTHLELLVGDQSSEGVDVVIAPYVLDGDAMVLAPGVAASAAGFGFPESIDAEAIAPARFNASVGERLVLRQEPRQPTLLALGLGSEPAWTQWAKAAAEAVRDYANRVIRFAVPNDDISTEAIATGALLGSYSFSKRRDVKVETGAVGLVIVDGEPGIAQDSVTRGRAIANAVACARDLVNEPPSTMTPAILAQTIASNLDGVRGVDLEIWDKAKIEQERLGGLLGVSRGSAQDPRLVIGSYRPEGATDETPHVVLVGKGVTFDSGGLSLKTAGGMTTMKTDMTGAAVVLNALSALDALGVSVKVTAIAPMTENMVSGSATKPGDVLVARNGLTMEVLNTDAEGRLILADALCLAEEMKPDTIIDVATLTGAAVVALGKEMGAVLARPRELAAQIIEAGSHSAESFWELPLFASYESHIDSEIADIKNIGAAGEAGTSSAALFLGRFVESTSWAHLDIAGPGRSERSTGLVTKGGTAFGLLTLLRYLRSLG